ncbi:DUF3606 domain-containing protein [Stenotrophomonas sp. MMGLT7]|uniref:DUF3606 domain-containing protein n=1 Tax=Stenotrophomonas sp. MMGLT7 TaxID=2901227 RepID=UPI002F907F37
MGETPQQRRPADTEKISLTEEWELKWWAKELGASPENLKAAVEAVGNATTQVRQYLNPNP